MAVCDQVQEALHGYGLADAALERRSNRDRAGDRFQAASVSAAADRAARVRQRVANFSRHAGDARVGAAFEDQARADAGL